MIAKATTPLRHYGFPGDALGRCGIRGRLLALSAVPAHVTCRACLAELLPVGERPAEIVVTLRLRGDHLPVLERLAKIAGRELDENTGAIVSNLLEEQIARLRALLLTNAPREVQP